MFKADAGTLAAALAKVVPVVERRNTIPILECARLRIEAGVLTVSASNFDQQIDATATVTPAGNSGEIAVSARRLLTILSRLSKREAIELVNERERIVLNWNGGRLALPARLASDFPELEFGAGDVAEGQLDDQVREGLARCWPFISKEETRYYLNGICLWPAEAGSRIIATDGRRLCTMPGGPSLDAIVGQVGQTRAIIPRDVVKLWLGLGAAADLRLRLRADGIKMDLESDGFRLRSKMIDGAYPLWERVIPPTSEMRALTVPRVALLNAVGVTQAVLGKGELNGLIVVEDGRLQLQAHTIEGNEVAVDVGPVEGAPLTIGANPPYLRGAIDATRGKMVTIWVGPDNGAMRLEGSEAEAGEAIVLMPLRSVTRASFSAPALAEAA